MRIYTHTRGGVYCNYKGCLLAAELIQLSVDDRVLVDVMCLLSDVGRHDVDVGRCWPMCCVY